MMNVSTRVLQRLPSAPASGSKNHSSGLSYLNKDHLFQLYRIATGVFFFIAGRGFIACPETILLIPDSTRLLIEG
jgi:hypothetical protein